MTEARPGTAEGSAPAAGQGRSELGVALFLAVVGATVVGDALLLADSVTARGPVGPKAVPLVVGGLLLVVGVLLFVDVLRGGRGEPEGGEDVDLSHGSDWRTLAVLFGAFLVNVLLIERLGWPVTGAVLFFGCAYALGSRRVVRDVVLAFVLSIGSWYLFFLGLDIELPVGVLNGIL